MLRISSQPVFAAGRIAVDESRGRRQRRRPVWAPRISSRGRTTSTCSSATGARVGTRTRLSTTASLSTPASSSTTSATIRCSVVSSASWASPHTSRTCPSRSAAPAAGSSTPAGARSRSPGTSPGPGSSGCCGRSGAGCGRRGRGDETQSLAEYLDEHGYSRRFRRHFLVPLTSALWSTAPGRALEFPAAYAIRFFDNHGMLGFGRFRWRTVTGGSRRYVDAIAAGLGDRLRLGNGIRSVRRSPDGVELRIGDRVERFDHVVLATHADQALATARGSDSRRAARARRLRLHDERGDAAHRLRRICRERRGPRASWNYRLGDDGRPTITYHLNRLQALDVERDYCVTLNEQVAGGARPRSGSPTSTRSTRSRRCARRPSCRGSPAGARTTRAPTSATASTRTASRAASRRRAALGVEW